MLDQLIQFIKNALQALCDILGITLDPEFADNIESAIEDVVGFGKDAAAE